MSTAITRAGRMPAISDELQNQLAETSSRTALAFSQAGDGDVNVTAALEVAAGMQEMRALFDRPEVKERIVALQDTPIGFRTDRDPSAKGRNGQPNVAYGYNVVRDCAIEAVMRGLQLVGNQFNIISSRQYTTKEGFEYLIRRCKSVSDFRPVIGVPSGKTGGSTVECKATWKLNGNPQNLEVVIPVKTDDWSGADQIIGKATRKFLKRCYEMMTGQSTPDGEVENDPVIVTEAKPAPAPRVGRAKASDSTAPTSVVSESTDPASEPAPERPQMRLARLLDESGIQWPEASRSQPFIQWLDGQEGRPSIEAVTGYGDIPDDIAAKLIGQDGKAIGCIAQIKRERMWAEAENQKSQQPHR